MSLPFAVETPLEIALTSDPELNQGLEYGRPRRGHPEGAVKWHVAEVLQNVDRWYGESPWRESLRVIAIVHDSFKLAVDQTRPKTGDNHHATIARRFAERFLSDVAVLEVIELHDEAYNAWRAGADRGNWDHARRRANALIERLGESLNLYLAFFHCDNATGDKQSDSWEWFVELARGHTAGQPPDHCQQTPADRTEQRVVE